MMNNPINDLYPAEPSRSTRINRAKLAVLASGEGTNLQAILDMCESERLSARVVVVACNHKTAHAIDRAERAGIPVIYHPLKWYMDMGHSREQYDSALADAIAEHEPDWVVLAGWMHVLSMSFLGRFPNRVINLHPALPGQFPGPDAIALAFEAFQQGKITETGVTVHFVPDEGVDTGPAIASAHVPIAANETLESLTARMHATEHRVLIEALRRVLKR